VSRETSSLGVLITGTSRGIGFHLAHAYLGRGAKVFGISRSKQTIEHENYTHFSLDVSDDKAVSNAMRLIAKSGGLHILINSAAIKKDSLSVLTPVAIADAMMKTNQLGSFVIIKHAAQLMKRNRRGRVVNLSSVAVPLVSMGTVIYGATKAAVEQMTQVFSREFAECDINFNTIGISFVEGTEMYEGIGAEEIANMERQLLKPGSVQLNELMAAIDFFTSDAAAKITGQSLYFGGVS